MPVAKPKIVTQPRRELVARRQNPELSHGQNTDDDEDDFSGDDQDGGQRLCVG